MYIQGDHSYTIFIIFLTMVLEGKVGAVYYCFLKSCYFIPQPPISWHMEIIPTTSLEHNYWRMISWIQLLCYLYHAYMTVKYFCANGDIASKPLWRIYLTYLYKLDISFEQEYSTLSTGNISTWKMVLKQQQSSWCK